MLGSVACCMFHSCKINNLTPKYHIVYNLTNVKGLLFDECNQYLGLKRKYCLLVEYKCAN